MWVLFPSSLHLTCIFHPSSYLLQGPLADQQDLVLSSQQQCSTSETTGESQGGDEGGCPALWCSGDMAVERNGLQLSLTCAPHSPLWLVIGVGAGY